MLGTAWIDRPVDTQGLRSRFHRPFLVQHGSAAMLKPMIDDPSSSLRCPPEALHRTTRKRLDHGRRRRSAVGETSKTRS